MPKKHPKYRLNPERSVEIFGPIDDALVGRLGKQILDLRKESAPISIYIQSLGGSVLALRALDNLLFGFDQDGSAPYIISAAIGHVASAAATLLTIADYAIAYDRSLIHFHVLRYSDVAEVTVENASDLSARLAKQNRQTAERLAEKMFPRIVHRLSELRAEIRTDREAAIAAGRTLELHDAFFACVSARISFAGDLVLRTIGKLQTTIRLWEKVTDVLAFDSEDPGAVDAAVIKAIIDADLGTAPNQRLDEAQLAQIASEYFLLRDYATQGRVLRNLVEDVGWEFLTDDEFDRFSELEAQKKTDEASEMVRELCLPRLRPFWFYTLLLARGLQEGENELTCAEAYWLGVVDEVLGTPMIGLRKLMERDDPAKQDGEK